MTKALTVKLPNVTKEITISEKWLVARDELLKRSKAIKAVEGQEDFETACELQNQVTKTSNKLESMRKDISKPFADAQKLIKAAADKAREPLEGEKSRLKNLTGAYAEKQRQAQLAEQRRIEKEQREAAEKQLAEQRKEQEALDALGIEEEPEQPEPEITVPEPEPTVLAPQSDAARVVTSVEWDLVNEPQVPRAFMSFDPRKVNEYKRSHNESLKKRLEDDPASGNQIVPGIVFRIKTDVRGGAR
jgi:hypothetical protein